MKSEFCYLFRVRYSECDAQKVVFNARYVDYIDIAVTEFTRVIWGSYNDVLSSGIDNQVVNLNIDWKAPAHFDEVIAATVKLSRMGTTSYSLQVDFYNYESQQLLSSGIITYVMVSANQHTKINIPEDMRQQLEKGAAAVTINHSGSVSNT